MKNENKTKNNWQDYSVYNFWEENKLLIAFTAAAQLFMAVTFYGTYRPAKAIDCKPTVPVIQPK